MEKEINVNWNIKKRNVYSRGISLNRLARREISPCWRMVEERIQHHDALEDQI